MSTAEARRSARPAADPGLRSAIARAARAAARASAGVLPIARKAGGNTPGLVDELERYRRAYEEASAARLREGYKAARAKPSSRDVIAAITKRIRKASGPEREQLLRAREAARKRPGPREEAIAALVSREGVFTEQHALAQVARARGFKAQRTLEETSPGGAFWELGKNVQNHTPDCELLAGNAWRHEVLRQHRPPLHGGCQCRIISIREARRRGLYKGGIPDASSDADFLEILDAYGHTSLAEALMDRPRMSPKDWAESRWVRDKNGRFADYQGGTGEINAREFAQQELRRELRPGNARLSVARIRSDWPNLPGAQQRAMGLIRYSHSFPEQNLTPDFALEDGGRVVAYAPDGTGAEAAYRIAPDGHVSGADAERFNEQARKDLVPGKPEKRLLLDDLQVGDAIAFKVNDRTARVVKVLPNGTVEILIAPLGRQTEPVRDRIGLSYERELGIRRWRTGDALPPAMPEGPLPPPRELTPPEKLTDGSELTVGMEEGSPERAIVKALHGFTYGGLTVQINGIGKYGFSGRVLDEQGRRVGAFARDLSLDEGRVYHSNLQLDVRYRGTGFGGAFVERSLDAYKELGLKRVTVAAGLAAGGYKWARMGFQFDWADRGKQVVPFAAIDAIEEAPAPLREEMKNLIETGVLRTPQDIAEFGLDSPWEVRIPAPDGGTRPVRMWLGKRAMMGTEWEGHLDLDRWQLRETVDQTEDWTESEARLAAVLKAARTDLVDPDDPVLDDDHGFWVRVRDAWRAAAVSTAPLLEAEKHTGVMVALYPEPGVAKALAVKGGEPVDDIHLTLAFLGDSKDLKDPDGLRKAVEGWAQACPPLAGEISGVGLFTAGETPVRYASADIPLLPENRERLVGLLLAGGFPVAQDHSFTPHLTICYDDREVRVPNRVLRFAEVALVVGGKRAVFPLAGAKGKLGEALRSTLFDPRDHPRDTRGQFRETLGQLLSGQLVKMPDGMSVTALGDGAFRVRGGGRPVIVDGAGEATRVALDRNARRKNADSVGGLKSYMDFEAAVLDPATPFEPDFERLLIDRRPAVSGDLPGRSVAEQAASGRFVPRTGAELREARVRAYVRRWGRDEKGEAQIRGNAPVEIPAVNPAVVAAVDVAQAKNVAHLGVDFYEYWQQDPIRLVASVGLDDLGWEAVARADGGISVAAIEKRDGDGHSFLGGTAPFPVAGSAEERRMGSATPRDIGGILRHEHFHGMENELTGEQQALYRRFYPRVEGGGLDEEKIAWELGGNAGSSSFEAGAEVWALTSDPRFRREDWPGWVGDASAAMLDVFYGIQEDAAKAGGVEEAFDPDQLRGPDGRWAGGAGGARGASGLMDMIKQMARMSRGMSGGNGQRKPGDRARSAYEYVEDYGQSWKIGQQVPADSPLRGAQGECYKNAADVILGLGSQRVGVGYRYVEGFAFPEGLPLPIQHAWLVNEKDEVLDVTWPKAGSEYVGAVIEDDVLRRVLIRTETYGVLDWMSIDALYEGEGGGFASPRPRAGEKGLIWATVGPVLAPVASTMGGRVYLVIDGRETEFAEGDVQPVREPGRVAEALFDEREHRRGPGGRFRDMNHWVSSLPMRAFRVGGAVRDPLLGKEPKDVDFMLLASPEKIRDAVIASGGRAEDLVVRDRLVGVRAHVPGVTPPEGVELAPPRVERSTGPGRHDFVIEPHPAVTNPAGEGWDGVGRGVMGSQMIADDAARRDFSINALYQDEATGEVIDPLGGLADLEKRELRTTSPDSFLEDPLRILRGLRFMSQFGMDLAPETEAQMREHAGSVTALTQRGVSGTAREELSKILMGEHVGKALRKMRDTGVMAEFLPELRPMLGYDQENAHHDLLLDEHVLRVVDGVASQGATLHVRLAALFHDSGKPASAWRSEDGKLHYYGSRKIDAKGREKLGPPDARAHQDVGAEIGRAAMERLGYDERTIALAERVIQSHMVPMGVTNPKSVRKWRAKVGVDIEDDVLAHRRADFLAKDDPGDGPPDIERFAAIVRQERDAKAPTVRQELAINGKDLVAIGIEPGPQMGAILRDLLDRVVEDPSLNRRDWLLQQAKAMVEEALSEGGSFELLHPRGAGGVFRQKISRLGFSLQSGPAAARNRTDERQGGPRPSGQKTPPVVPPKPETPETPEAKAPKPTKVPGADAKAKADDLAAYHRGLLPAELLREDGRPLSGENVPRGMVKAPDGHPAVRKLGKGYAMVVPEEGERDGLIGVGVDKKGRVKRVYSDAFEDGKRREKFVRIARLVDKLPDLDRKLRADAGKGNDVADALLLIRATAMRPGQKRDRGGDSEAYGATTLQARHVIDEDGALRLEFPAKGGKPTIIDVRDPDAAAMIRERLKSKKGEEYLFDASPAKLNAYLKKATDPAYVLKDVRTVVATTLARRLALDEDPKTPAEAKAAKARIAKAVSEVLGNTPAVATKSYISPEVFTWKLSD